MPFMIRKRGLIVFSLLRAEMRGFCSPRINVIGRHKTFNAACVKHEELTFQSPPITWCNVIYGSSLHLYASSAWNDAMTQWWCPLTHERIWKKDRSRIFKFQPRVRHGWLTWLTWLAGWFLESGYPGNQRYSWAKHYRLLLVHIWLLRKRDS